MDVSATEPVLRAGSGDDSRPLSYAQELVWLLGNASPGLIAYNMPVARRLKGALDIAALERSLGAIAARHDVLRTRFVVSGGEPAAFVDEARPLALRYVDLRELCASERDARAAATVGARAREPFDFAREHAFRPTLVQLSDDDHILLMELHHIACDGWSVGVIFGELAALYRADITGAPITLPPLEIRYSDFARWQREMLDGNWLERSLTYWRAELDAPSEPLELPVDGTPESADDAAIKRTLDLDADLAAALRQLARERKATPYMALLALFATLLHRSTGLPSFRVGTNVAGRMNCALEPLVGYFNNTLALRCDFSGEPTFDDVLSRVRERCLGAFDHQDVPYEKLALGAAPLFNVVFSADNAAELLTLADVGVEPYALDLGVTKFDLSLFMNETPQGVRLTLYARSRIWSAATTERFLEQLRILVHGAVATPQQRIARLPLLTVAERTLAERSNATAADTGSASVLDRFEAQAARVPDATALVCDDELLTYAALDARASALALRLRERGVTRNVPVGLAAERTTHAVAGFLGILKAGGVVVPFESGVAPERLRQQLSVAEVRHVVKGVEIERILADDLARSEPRTDDLAYIVFTSGSTGVPKGVAVTHDNLRNYVGAITRVIADVGVGWHVGLSGTLAADLGYTAFFAALCTGATLHVLADEVTNDAARFAEYLRTRPLDVLKITPRHLRALAAGAALATILPARLTILGGEALELDFADELLAAGRGRILNHYGPTETTVGATTFDVTAVSLAAARSAGARTVPIGFPLANVQGHVYDSHLGPMPLGTIGELHVGGAGVAAGYFGRSDLTSERFSTQAASGRVYRTGDRVRRLPDGALEYMGRSDDQVKVRGFRVELGEIEAALRTLPEIADAAALVSGDTEAPVTAYVVLARGAPLPTVTERLESRLPGFMIPGTVVVVDVLPRTASGKLDRQALVAAGASQPAIARTQTPRTSTESALIDIWAEAFKRDAASIHVDDDFLELGGHSLIAIRMLGKVNRRFGVRLPLASVLEARTVARLAARIDERAGDTNSADGPALVRIPRLTRP